jgi:ParB/RepB/Spo0J family partition protein
MSNGDIDIQPGDYADVMPDMSEEEYEALKQSIREHGFDATTPIVIDEDGQIVDGHHRYCACEELGVDPVTTTVESPDVEQAYRSNLSRRNLNDGTKRDVVEQYLKDHYDGDRTQQQVAEDLGVSPATVSRAMESLSPEKDFPPSEKRQQARAYLDDNPDASNREVAREIEADVSHPTIGNWRDEWESDNDGEDASVDGDDAEVSGPQSVSGPTDAVSGPDEADKPLDTDGLPDGYDDTDDGEDIEEIADRGDDNVDVDVVDHGPGGENDTPASAVDEDDGSEDEDVTDEELLQAFADRGGHASDTHVGLDVAGSPEATGGLRKAGRFESLQNRGLLESSDASSSHYRLTHRAINRYGFDVEKGGDGESAETEDDEGDDLDIEDFESFDPEEYELDADTREDVEELCRDVLGDDVDSQELEGRVDELESVLEDMVRAFENQDVQTLERVAEGRAKEVLNA